MLGFISGVSLPSTHVFRYAAPIYVDIEYVTESNGKKSIATKASFFFFFQISILYFLTVMFSTSKSSYHVKLVFSEWCNYWENAYNVKKLLLSLIWERWRRTGKTWLVNWELYCIYKIIVTYIQLTDGALLEVLRNWRSYVLFNFGGSSEEGDKPNHNIGIQKDSLIDLGFMCEHKRLWIIIFSSH